MKNKSILSFLVLSLSLSLTLAWSAFAQDNSSDGLAGQSPQAPEAANSTFFTAYLNGASEVPANASTATGYGRVSLNAAETQITASFYWTGIGPGTTSGHIHGPAAVGVNAPVLFNMAPATATSGSKVDMVFNVTPTDVANLRAGLLYFNIHTATNFSGGEIRGQIRANAPAKADYSGDGKTDYGILRSNGQASGHQTWFILFNGGGGGIQTDWGLGPDVPAPADYDGDGKTDLAIWRQSGTPTFYILRSFDNTFTATNFGTSGDIPISADYTGDGKADMAVYRSGATSSFWYRASSGPFVGTPVAVPFGTNGDLPAPGDFNGDGKADFCYFRNAGGKIAFNIRYGTDSVAPGQPDTVTYFGNYATDSVVAGDFDGDGSSDLAVTRIEGGQMVWYYSPSSGGAYRRFVWGIPGDLQVPGDYDGDGKTDIAIWRASGTPGATAFYVLGTTSGFIYQAWGTGSDTPVNFDVLQ